MKCANETVTIELKNGIFPLITFAFPPFLPKTNPIELNSSQLYQFEPN